MKLLRTSDWHFGMPLGTGCRSIRRTAGVMSVISHADALTETIPAQPRITGEKDS